MFCWIQGETSVHFIEVKNEAPYLNPGTKSKGYEIAFKDIDSFTTCIKGRLNMF